MININFKIKNQTLTRTDNQNLIRNSKNIIKASFEFETETWNDINKFVIFTDSWDEQIITHIGKSEKCSCIIPSSCLKGTFFKITVYGGDLVTTNNMIIPLKESGYTTPHRHYGCGHEHKDVFVDIFDKLDTKIDSILFNEKCLQLYADGILVDSICLNGFADEAQVIEWMSKTDLDQLTIKNSIDEIESLLVLKSDIGHTHNKDDILDFEDSVDLDIENLLSILTENINNI